MTRAQPMFASDRTAAKLLDMRVGEFRDLVDQGALPGPCAIAGSVKRWDVEELQATLRGHKPKPKEELEL